MTQRGFTLLEMLVVLVLLGLMTTLALPAMQRWHDGVQVRARAAGIVEVLRGAAFAAGANRQEAVMDEHSFVAAASTARDAAPAAAKADASAPGVPEAAASAPVNTRRKLEIVLPAGWRVERVATARFLANGLCQPGEAVLRTERDERLSVRVRGPVCGAELATGQDAS